MQHTGAEFFARGRSALAHGTDAGSLCELYRWPIHLGVLPSADAILFDVVRADITALSTYVYRRAGALVKRTRTLMGLPAIDHERLYRIMKASSLLLPKAPKCPVRR